MERRSGGDRTQQTNVHKGKVQVGTKETHDSIPQGADSAPLPLGAAKTGINNLNKYKFSPHHRTGERYSQTILIICLAATFPRRERPYKRIVELTQWDLYIKQHS